MPMSDNELRPTCRKALLSLLRELENGQMPMCLPGRIDQLPVGFRHRHFHILPELVIQISGESILHCPGEDLHIKPGEMCITPSCLPHREQPAVTPEPFLNLVLLFMDQSISMHAAEPRGGGLESMQMTTLHTKHLNEMLTYVEQIVQHWHSESTWHKQILRGLGIALVAELLEALDQHTGKIPESRKVELCTKIVMHRLSDPNLSVRMLAESVGWSPDYLSFAFHSDTGLALHSFIAEKRHDLAKRLLIGSELTIAEICVACGYEDPSYFTRVFKRYQGCTPSTFRTAQTTEKRP